MVLDTEGFVDFCGESLLQAIPIVGDQPRGTNPAQFILVFDQQGPRSGTGGANCGRGTRGATTDDHHIPTTENRKVVSGQFNLRALLKTKTGRDFRYGGLRGSRSAPRKLQLSRRGDFPGTSGRFDSDVPPRGRESTWALEERFANRIARAGIGAEDVEIAHPLGTEQTGRKLPSLLIACLGRNNWIVGKEEQPLGMIEHPVVVSGCSHPVEIPTARPKRVGFIRNGQGVLVDRVFLD